MRSRLAKRACDENRGSSFMVLSLSRAKRCAVRVGDSKSLERRRTGSVLVNGTEEIESIDEIGLVRREERVREPRPRIATRAFDVAQEIDRHRELLRVGLTRIDDLPRATDAANDHRFRIGDVAIVDARPVAAAWLAGALDRDACDVRRARLLRHIGAKALGEALRGALEERTIEREELLERRRRVDASRCVDVRIGEIEEDEEPLELESAHLAVERPPTLLGLREIERRPAHAQVERAGSEERRIAPSFDFEAFPRRAR